MTKKPKQEKIAVLTFPEDETEMRLQINTAGTYRIRIRKIDGKTVWSADRID